MPIDRRPTSTFFLTLLAFVHGSLILQEVYQSGPVDLAFPWLSCG